MTPEEKAKWWLENERLSVKQNQKWLTQALREARAEGALEVAVYAGCPCCKCSCTGCVNCGHDGEESAK